MNNLYEKITKGIAQAWKIFIRPPRFKYESYDLG